MSTLVRQLLLAAAGLFAAAAAVAGEIILFEYPDFGGRRITLRGAVSNFDPSGFNDRASSLVIRDGYWELCTDAYFRGRCATFGPGEYRGLASQLTDTISSAREVGGPPPGPIIGGGGGSPRIELWERREYGGRSIVLTSGVPDFERIGFNDRADAAVVMGVSGALASTRVWAASAAISGRVAITTLAISVAELVPRRSSAQAAVGLPGCLSAGHARYCTNTRVSAAAASSSRAM